MPRAIFLAVQLVNWFAYGSSPTTPIQIGGDFAYQQLRFPVSRRQGAVALILFTALFLIPPLLAATTGHQGIALFGAFYRSGALVFGGGHVVLSLLQAHVVTPVGFRTRPSWLVMVWPRRSQATVYLRRLSWRGHGADS
jgi:hypothetical protein